MQGSSASSPMRKQPQLQSQLNVNKYAPLAEEQAPQKILTCCPNETSRREVLC